MPNGVLLCWLTLLFYQPLAATASTPDTLAKVRQNGELVVGYYETEIPFSYVDGKGNIVGYSYEMTQKIARSVQKHLRLENLKIKPQVLTLQNRFAMIQNGNIDLECASSTHTRQRAQSVGFSTSIFIGSIRIMTHKNSGIRDVADLADKTVVTKSTATAEQIIAKIKQDKKINFKTMVSIDRTTTPLMLLQTGQADAYLLDDALLVGVINEAWRPDDWIVTGQAQSFEAYGCMMKKGDAAFKRVVDQAIIDLMKSGEAEALYQKWFMAPIPPKGRNLQFPLSSLMKNLFTRPNDQPFQ
jgi:glutamate/aspartate transport system substrate-binding protein